MSEVDAALALLGASDPRARLAGVTRLGDLGDSGQAVLDALIVALDDADGDVRVAAVNALTCLDPRETEDAIRWAMQSPDLRVAIAAKTSVQRTAKLRGPDSTLWRDPATGYSD